MSELGGLFGYHFYCVYSIFCTITCSCVGNKSFPNRYLYILQKFFKMPNCSEWIHSLLSNHTILSNQFTSNKRVRHDDISWRYQSIYLRITSIISTNVSTGVCGIKKFVRVSSGVPYNNHIETSHLTFIHFMGFIVGV